MHSMNQLICIFTFIFLLLPPTFSTGLVLKPECPDRCGDLLIPYPFGVGLDCSFETSYNINCTSTVPPKAYLSIMNKEVIEINETYIRVKYPNLISTCYDLSITAEPVTHSMPMNLSGTPYTLSYLNRLTAIGCDDMVLQSNGSSGMGGCSAFCEEKKDTGPVGYCPTNATLLSNGCCQVTISKGTDFLEAQLIDLSRNLLRKKLFPCSYAFIQEEKTLNATVFSYPLFYLDNLTALVDDNWASTTRPPVVRLDWTIIGAENCSRAKTNNNTYACRDDKSVCVDEAQDYSVGIGYQCRCVQGYEGNPYLPGGCKTISFSGSSVAKAGCQDQCGKLSIPFPFGVGSSCYREPSFEIVCNTSTNPPRAYLPILNKEIIYLNSSQVRVSYPNMGLACYNLSDYPRGITKIEEHSLIIDLSTTQYTLSDANCITAFGCNDMVVGSIEQGGNRRFIGSSCATVCSEERIDSSYYGECPYTYNVFANTEATGYRLGDGCCKALVPRGTTYLEANLSDLSGQWRRRRFFSCSFAFVGIKSSYFSYPLEYLNNSTATPPDDPMSGRSWRPIIVELDWRIGAVNCKEAKQNQTTYACLDINSDCVDFDATVGGYLCNCSKGYQGNPYLPQGCLDIDECGDNTTNPCDSKSICINTHGSCRCSCLKGYYGDGRKDGMGCIQKPQTKMIILIGVGSGLGFVLVLLMCFWLYKVLQKRKEKLVKEKFFKRNGGLLLRQQTNEGALGKTKVFLAKDLEVATDYFNENRILGHGGQGIVYKGMLSDGKIVAIKKSKLVEENQLEQFINEVAILSQINHRNVVKLLGCCLETEVPLLVYEFMPNGTLFDLIHDPNKEFPFPWNMRLKTAADIAGALAYLHSASSMPIYHRDIKSSNILLDEKYVVKVSDFGTSRSIATDQTHLTTMVKGTFGYLDPEYFQSSQFTEKSDVYSFGVVLVELLTGQRPISLDKTDEERGLATRFLTSMEENYLDKILDPQVLEQGMKEDVILVARLAKRCLNLKGKMRPTMKEVATELESFRISHMSVGAKDEFEGVRDFEDLPTTISDIEYTWTASYKSVTASSSDTHPLIITKK